MSMLDDMMKKAGAALGQATQGGGQANLASVALKMLGDTQAGGLAGLVQAFQSKGLGDVISSWIGTGANLPISADQLKGALGADRIQQLATQAGISPDSMSTGLAQVLPGLVDKLTPNGKIPEGNLLEQGMQLLKGKLL